MPELSPGAFTFWTEAEYKAQLASWDGCMPEGFLYALTDGANQGFYVGTNTPTVDGCTPVDPCFAMKADDVCTILLTGESNAVSSAPAAAGGTLVPDPRIRFWTGSEWVMMDPANGVGVPVAGRNSEAFQVARQALEKGCGRVYVVVSAEAGQPVSHWTAMGAASPGFIALDAMASGAMASAELTALGVTGFDFVIIDQGVNDGGPDFVLDDFTASHELFRAQLRTRSYVSKNTPIYYVELGPQPSNAGPNTYFNNVVPYDTDPYAMTVETGGIHSGTGDLSHWTGANIDEVGCRICDTHCGVAKPSMANPASLRGDFARIVADVIFGKGLGAAYLANTDQVVLGPTSDNLAETVSTNGALAFDLNDQILFTLGKFVHRNGFRSLGATDIQFQDISADINANNPCKIEGQIFQTGDGILAVATGDQPGDPWNDALGNLLFTPV